MSTRARNQTAPTARAWHTRAVGRPESWALASEAGRQAGWVSTTFFMRSRVVRTRTRSMSYTFDPELQPLVDMLDALPAVSQRCSSELMVALRRGLKVGG